jgi:hypothetical protein
MVGVGVLHDQAGDPLRVPGSQPEADWPAEVEHVHHEPVQPQVGGKAVQDVG